MQHWKKAVELQPRHAQALFSLGTVYLETGELADAESAFSRSLAADPANMKTEYNLALVLNKLGKPDEAKQHLERYRKMQEEEHATSGNARACNAKNVPSLIRVRRSATGPKRALSASHLRPRQWCR